MFGARYPDRVPSRHRSCPGALGGAALLAVAVLAVGCGHPANRPAQAPSSPSPSRSAQYSPAVTPSPALVLAVGDGNRTVPIGVGEIVSARLGPDRAWSPPTSSDPAVLQVLAAGATSGATTPGATTPGRITPGGITEASFRALRPGQAVLTSMGSCRSTPGAATCHSIEVWRVSVVVA